MTRIKPGKHLLHPVRERSVELVYISAYKL